MTVRLDLGRPVTDLPSAKLWIERLIGLGLMFHFEDAADTIVDIRSGDPIFTPEEEPIVRARVAALYDLDWAHYGCPLGYAQSVEDRLAA